MPVRLGWDGCSLQFGRTSMCLPRLPHFAQTTWRLKYGTSGFSRVAPHVDHCSVAAGIIQARCNQPLHAELAHVAERHRRTGGVLEFGCDPRLTAEPQLALYSDPLVRLGWVLDSVTMLPVAFGHLCLYHV
jgi:hypothetical protein